jgi:putative ABC transport system ATP-binding protein
MRLHNQQPHCFFSVKHSVKFEISHIWMGYNQLMVVKNGASPLICLRGVKKTYSGTAGEFPALKGIDLEINQGEFVSVTGKSGAGKTTLVNIITGVDHITAGEVWVGGELIHQMNESKRSRWRGSFMGVVYQTYQLLPNLTVLDNVMLPMDFCGYFKQKISPKKAIELLREVEIEEHANKIPANISGGQQQRVAIARALANDPPIIVADEPTGRLDSVTGETIFQIFERLSQQGKTILMVTHDTSLAKRTQRVLYLEDGCLTGEERNG